MWYVFLLLWILSMAMLITILKYEVSDKVLILLSQIYNFITGFLGWAISFVVSVFVVKCFGDIENVVLLCVIFSGLVITGLLVPLNIKVKEKIRMKAILYVILSIFNIVLGCGSMVTWRYVAIRAYKLIRSEI